MALWRASSRMTEKAVFPPKRSKPVTMSVVRCPWNQAGYPVNPDRVYVMGYSAGGDGVYQLAPRMADTGAAAAMMGGHPNGVSLLSLRNVPFDLQVGANDRAYDRNWIGKEYGEQLDRR